MKTTNTTNSRNKNIFYVALGTAFVLLTPLVAMQFSDEVDWGLIDFVVAGTLLGGTGFIFELLVARAGAKHRAVVAVMLAAALLLVWAELAVGVFGTPFAGS